MAVYTPEQRPPRLALGMYKRFLLAAVIIFLASAGAVATAALLELKDDVDFFSNSSTPIAGIDEKGILDDVDPGQPQTLLLLGSDRRYVDIKTKAPTRSDTIILVRLDPDRGATAVMSLPRDLKVDIPGFGTDKINAAYADGGPKLTVKTVRALLGIPINHVVNVNFGGFQSAVDRLGCVYTDVDRRYFNDNSPPNGGGGDYSAINVKAGYQKLCGERALEYVRYRHFDNDIVRAARQQDFLRQAKDQIGLSQLVSDRKQLIKIFGRYTQTDIRGTGPILTLLKLALDSASQPIQEVHVDDLGDDGSYLTASPENLKKAAEQFTSAEATKGPRAEVKKTDEDKRAEAKQTKQAKRSNSGAVPTGLLDTGRQGEGEAALLGAKLSFPTYYPRYQRVGGVPQTNDTRAYKLVDRSGKAYDAYRLVVSAPGVGQYYGVQGTSWMNPPLLDSPSETRTVDGRKLELFFDGDRLRLVAWRTPRAVYWVSNTLLQSLTNKQMLGIAGSLARVGA